MNEKEVVMVGFDSKAFLILQPLVCKLFGIANCDCVETETELFHYESCVAALFVSTGYFGFDFTARVARIRAFFGSITIICYAAHMIEGRIGTFMAKAGIDVLYANIDSKNEYDRASFAIRNRQRYFPRNVRDVLFAQDAQVPVKFFQLTGKEKECLLLTVRGLSIKEIGKEMRISHGTVSAMRRNTQTKIGARSTSEMIYLARMYRFVNEEVC